MKKELWIIIALAVIAIALGAIAYMNYGENQKLNSEITRLNADNEKLNADKAQTLADNKNLRDELQLLNEDVAAIYKTCITQNACKGHYPGIRWYCNNIGDAVQDIAMASHLCECDSACELKTTIVQNI